LQLMTTMRQDGVSPFAFPDNQSLDLKIHAPKKLLPLILPSHTHQDTKHGHYECRKHDRDERDYHSGYWETPFCQSSLYDEIANKTNNKHN